MRLNTRVERVLRVHSERPRLRAPVGDRTHAIVILGSAEGYRATRLHQLTGTRSTVTVPLPVRRTRLTVFARSGDPE